MHWLYLAIAIVAEVVGTSFLKGSAGFTKLGPSLMVLAGYGTAFLFLSLTLERIRGLYRGLLDAYFGPGFVVDKQLELQIISRDEHAAKMADLLR